VQLPKLPKAKPPTAKSLAAKPSAAKPVGAQPAPAKPVAAKTPTSKPLTAKALTEGQRVYEAKRAAKAGMSLDKWLTSKQRQQEAEAKAKQKAVETTKPPKPPGFFGRLLERAQRPLRS